LADVVGRSGDYRPAQDDLHAFAAVYHESAELREVLKTPAISVADKTRVLEAILARLGTSVTPANFFRVLLANYRLALLDDIIEAYGKIVNERMGIARVQISSATELSPAERETLAARFEAVTRRTVEAAFEVDPRLLGGVTAQIGSTVYDGSVRGHLQRIRERLTAR
jgi:F-type H+-transporting ATPase subunit delta